MSNDEETYSWEPSYGFTKTDPVYLAAALETVRRKLCIYGQTARTCDCKYGLGKSITDFGKFVQFDRIDPEQTGCPELRSVIHMLLHGKVGIDLETIVNGLTRDNQS